MAQLSRDVRPASEIAGEKKTALSHLLALPRRQAVMDRLEHSRQLPAPTSR